MRGIVSTLLRRIVVVSRGLHLVVWVIALGIVNVGVRVVWLIIVLSTLFRHHQAPSP